MRITELLTRDTILLNIEGTQKIEAIDQLVAKLDTAGKLANKEEYKAAILKEKSKAQQVSVKESRFLMRKRVLLKTQRLHLAVL